MAKQKSFDINLGIAENIIEKPIEKVLPDSMMPYSEYVILDRALPRVEDGLKPVQRRILYAMHDMNMNPDGAYKKSAKVVGECLGKYHPHGDKSVYDAMVRMAQGFNMRMTLIDGHGNFGSIDGDSAAAMRYTEVRLESLATELLKDIEKGTVKWNKNFDDTLEEPDVLPGRYPNLLVNGSTGIAIGLATNIPSHNLTEVIDGTIAMIDCPNIKLEEMVKYIKGPDFPTGAFIVGGQSIIDTYKNGYGKIVMRAKTEIENDGDKQNIVITEIPYGVNKEQLQKRIYELKETKKDIVGNITDISDESDKTGMRIVIKLKKGEDAIKVLNYLIQKTDLQCNFNVNMVAIANGKPMQMSLLQVLKYYIDYQKSIVYKRSVHDINNCKKREHILEGLSVAIPNIDEVIAIIRAASSRSEAKQGLRKRFELSEAQAEAVLNLQLGNINKLDVVKYEKELLELRKTISSLSAIIGSSKEQLRVVKEELLEIRNKYKVKRLTAIVDDIADLEIKAFDPTKRTQKKGYVAIDYQGGIKFLATRSYMSVYRDIESGGLDSLTLSIAKCEPEVTTLVFCNKGHCIRVNSDNLKEKRWSEAGNSPFEIYPDCPEDEIAVCAIAVEAEDEDKDMYIYTKQGFVKRTNIKQLIVNKDFYQVMVLRDDDEVIGVEIVEENTTIMFVTSDGLCVNTQTDDYSIQGRIAGGVIGANLNDGAHVVYAGQTTVEAEGEEFFPLGEIAVLTTRGIAKKVLAREFESMKRNRKGIKIADLQQDESVIFASKVLEPFQIAILTNDEIRAVNTEDLKIDSRINRGKPAVFGIKIKRAFKHTDKV